MVELTFKKIIEINNRIELTFAVELILNSTFSISIENLKQLQEKSINQIVIWASNLAKLKSFQCHEWIHFNYISTWLQQFNLFHFLCAFLFLRYVSSVTIWLDHESLVPSKLASPSLCPTSIICCWCLLIPPYKSSCSNWCINTLTSTSLPSNNMLYNKQ